MPAWLGVSTHDAHAMADDERETDTSMLFYAIQSLAQRKVPKLRLLKRALSQPISYHVRTPSGISDDSIESIPPPPSYRSDSEDCGQNEEPPTMFRSIASSAAPSRPSTSGSATPNNYDSKSGIRWDIAESGFDFLSIAFRDSTSGAPHSQTLTRRAYVDGLAYMLRALPTNLKPEEEQCLREAFPSADGQGQLLVRTSGSQMENTASDPVTPQSTLHRFVATATLYACLLFSFILPYLHLFLRQAYLFDRKHKISDRVLTQSVVAADAMGKRTMTLATTICAMNEGRVGESMRDAGVYLLQGVSGGVYDGLGEGMQYLGLRGQTVRQEDS